MFEHLPIMMTATAALSIAGVYKLESTPNHWKASDFELACYLCRMSQLWESAQEEEEEEEGGGGQEEERE